MRRKRITILICICLLLFMVSCKKAAAPQLNQIEGSEDIAKKQEYVPLPRISFCSHHNYRDFSWMGEYIEGQDDSISFPGSGFSFDLVFDRKMDVESIRKGVVLWNCSDFEIQVDERHAELVHGYTQELEADKEYILMIGNSIKDTKGHTLKQDIRIKIRLQPDTKAYYTLLGEEEIAEDLGVPRGDHDKALQLTVLPKTFQIDFTHDVDKKSVEESLVAGLETGNTMIDLTWTDTRSLKIKLSNLEPGVIYPFVLSKAHDNNGNGIIGELFIKTDYPNEIGCIDINSGAHEIIKVFKDRRYMPWPNKSTDRYFLLENAGKISVYNHKSGQVYGARNLQYGFGAIGFVLYNNWLNSSTVLAYDRENERIVSHSLKNDIVRTVFALPQGISKENLFQVSLSPDKRKVALVVQEMETLMSVYVLTTDGRSVYQGKNLAYGRYLELLGPTINLEWLDDRYIILESDGDIIRLDTVLGKKDEVLENAVEPLPSPGGSVILAARKSGSVKTYLVFRDNKEKEILKGNLFEYTNFFFLDEERFVCNKNGRILLININKDTQEEIGTGFLCGTSPDRKKVYYLTNFKSLYAWE